MIPKFVEVTGEKLVWGAFCPSPSRIGLRPATQAPKETPTQAFSYEHCEIFKKTVFDRTPLVAFSVYWCIK